MAASIDIAKSRFLAAIGHDLMQPLQAAHGTGQTELVQRVGGVRDQLPQERVLVGVDGVDHQLQQQLVILSWQKKDGNIVKYDDEKTGYGWRTESLQPSYVGVQPTSCKMKKPA